MPRCLLTWLCRSLLVSHLPLQTERNDLLETVRQLTRTLKLKELIIANFIPEENARLLERRAAWVENEEGDGWVMPVSVHCVVAALGCCRCYHVLYCVLGNHLTG
jgi:hypothetical protein